MLWLLFEPIFERKMICASLLLAKAFSRSSYTSKGTSIDVDMPIILSSSNGWMNIFCKHSMIENTSLSSFPIRDGLRSWWIVEQRWYWIKVCRILRHSALLEVFKVHLSVAPMLVLNLGSTLAFLLVVFSIHLSSSFLYILHRLLDVLLAVDPCQK